MKKIWHFGMFICVLLNIFNMHQVDAKQKIVIDTNDVVFSDHFELSGSSQYIEQDEVKFVRLTEWVQGADRWGIYLKHKIDLRDDFTFKGTVGFGEMTPRPGDGMGFVFHPGKISDIGSTGGNLGVTPLKNALGFVIDTFNNNYQGTVGEEIVPYGAFWETGSGALYNTVKKSEVQKIVNSEDKRNFFNGKQKNIEFIYTAEDKRLRINYRDDQGNTMQWEKDLTEYVTEISALNPEGIPLVAFAVSASKDTAYNEHTVYFGNVKYTIYVNTVSYIFERSDAKSPTLPSTVTELLPAPQYGMGSGEVVLPENLETTEVDDAKNNGTWYFSGWNKESIVMRNEDDTFTGSWFFFRFPALTPVTDLTHISDVEKQKIEAEIRKSNPNSPVQAIEIQEDGTTRIIFESGSTKTLPPSKTITRVEQKIPFNIVYKDDENLSEWEEKIIQEGEEGISINGTVTKKPVHKIIHRGIKKRSSSGGPGGFVPTPPVSTVITPKVTPTPASIIPRPTPMPTWEAPIRTPGYILDTDSSSQPPIVELLSMNDEKNKTETTEMKKPKFILPKTGFDNSSILVLFALLLSSVAFVYQRRKNES